jgi:hypothetical protein
VVLGQGQVTSVFQLANIPPGLWPQSQAWSVWKPTAGTRIYISSPNTFGGEETPGGFEARPEATYSTATSLKPPSAPGA